MKENVSEVLAIALLSNHNLAHCNLAPTVADAAPAPTAPRGPKLERPKVDVGVTIEEWNVFTRRWEVFKSGSGIDDASAPSQLFQCAGTELGDSLLKANPNAASGTLTQLLAAMRSLAVIPVATCVLRTELLQLRQEHDEPFRTFTAKVRGKAETCSYTASCTCGASVDYTDHVIRDVILNGLYDTDIRREVLRIAGILETPINEIIALVESKEMARNALPSPSLSAVSSFVKQRKSPPNPVSTLSPAQIIFGRPLRDLFSFVNHLEKFSNPHIRPLWRQAWAAKEEALRTRITRTTKSLNAHSRPLTLGERVFLQNQQGPNPTKWDRSGVVVESAGHDQYRVKVDGSGRITLRNGRFLRAYTPATPSIHSQQPAASQLPTSTTVAPHPSETDTGQQSKPRRTVPGPPATNKSR